MPSTIPTSEKKRKSSKSSSKSKRSSKHSDDQQDLPGAPVKPTKSKKKSSRKLKEQLPVDDIQEELPSTDDLTEEVNDTKNDVEEATHEGEDAVNNATEDVSDKVEELSDNVDQADEELGNVKDKVQEAIDDDSETEGEVDSDALTTMNAIMEYNRMLVQKLHDLEEKTGNLNKTDIQNTVTDTMNEVSAKYNTKEDTKGTHHSFELPIGDMMKGYGSLSTSPLSDDDNEKENTKKADDEGTTVNGGDDGKIRIGDGEKDDIVVKVEATKTGITFSIHIPRN